MSTQALIGLFVAYLPNQKYRHAIGVSSLLLMEIPHAALMLYILYFILKKMIIHRYLNKRCWYLLGIVGWNQHCPVESNSHCGPDTDSLPDRLVNPEEYEPLIPAVNQQGTENFQNESYAVQARVTPMNTYGILD